MGEYYSSGELAKKCNVTIRTIQYYDKKGLLTPSRMSSGGRRQYTEKDYTKLKNICLYRSIGLSIEEIKAIIRSNDTETVENLISEHLIKIDEEIDKHKKNKQKLNVILEQIRTSGDLTAKSIDDLENIISRKKEYNKNSIAMIIVLTLYTAFVVFGSMYTSIQNKGIQFLFIALTILFMLILVFWNKKINAYRCSKCKNEFTISFWYDLISPNGFNGKYLRCPKCRKFSWCKSTYTK